MNEDQILSEYIDGELPPDLVERLNERLNRDPAFKARYEALLVLRATLKVTGADNGLIADMQAHVWQRVQRRVGQRPQAWHQWLSAFSDALHARIALPLPALAAMLVVVLTLGIVALARNAGANGPTVAQAAVTPNASSGTIGQSLVSLPSDLGTQSLVSSNLSTVGFGLQTNDAMQPENRSMEVTIQVQNLRQLLALLENNQDINRVTIQVPRIKNLQPYGKAIMLHSSELGIKPAMEVGVRASQP